MNIISTDDELWKDLQLPTEEFSLLLGNSALHFCLQGIEDFVEHGFLGFR